MTAKITTNTPCRTPGHETQAAVKAGLCVECYISLLERMIDSGVRYIDVMHIDGANEVLQDINEREYQARIAKESE